jgi:polysaccharide export outer membrane protein
VTGTPSFAQGVRVSASGDVTLPLLGQVHVDGLTPTEAERDISRRLVQRGILRNPQVNVNVIEYRSRPSRSSARSRSRARIRSRGRARR